MYVISCDPGKTGGICIFEDGVLVVATPVPVVDGHIDVNQLFVLWNVYTDWSEYTVSVMENVHSMPTDSKPSVMAFGRTTGNLEAMLRLASYGSLVEVTPQKWKKHFGLKGSDKEDAVKLVEELQPDIWDRDSEGYPEYFFDPSKKSINKQEKSGIADAYLIGKYYLATLADLT